MKTKLFAVAALAAIASMLVPALAPAQSFTTALSETTRVTVVLNTATASYEIVAEMRDRSAATVSDSSAPLMNLKAASSQIDIICKIGTCPTPARICRIASGVMLGDGTMTVSASDPSCTISFTATLGQFGPPQLVGTAMWQRTTATVSGISFGGTFPGPVAAMADTTGQAAKISALETPSGLPAVPAPPSGLPQPPSGLPEPPSGLPEPPAGLPDPGSLPGQDDLPGPDDVPCIRWPVCP